MPKRRKTWRRVILLLLGFILHTNKVAHLTEMCHYAILFGFCDFSVKGITHCGGAPFICDALKNNLPTIIFCKTKLRTDSSAVHSFLFWRTLPNTSYITFTSIGLAMWAFIPFDSAFFLSSSNTFAVKAIIGISARSFLSRLRILREA